MDRNDPLPAPGPRCHRGPHPLLYGSWWLVLYAIIVLTMVVGFVKGYEEPTHTPTYGEQYLNYRRHVPGWWPLLKPWRE